MAGLWDKMKEAAAKAAASGAKDPRLLKAALNVKAAVDNFKQGYREQMDPEAGREKCPHCQNDLPKNARFCPQCGAKVD